MNQFLAQVIRYLYPSKMVIETEFQWMSSKNSKLKAFASLFIYWLLVISIGKTDYKNPRFDHDSVLNFFMNAIIYFALVTILTLIVTYVASQIIFRIKFWKTLEKSEISFALIKPVALLLLAPLLAMWSVDSPIFFQLLLINILLYLHSTFQKLSFLFSERFFPNFLPHKIPAVRYLFPIFWTLTIALALGTRQWMFAFYLILIGLCIRTVRNGQFRTVMFKSLVANFLLVVFCLQQINALLKQRADVMFDDGFGHLRQYLNLVPCVDELKVAHCTLETANRIWKERFEAQEYFVTYHSLLNNSLKNSEDIGKVRGIQKRKELGLILAEDLMGAIRKLGWSNKFILGKADSQYSIIGLYLLFGIRLHHSITFEDDLMATVKNFETYSEPVRAPSDDEESRPE